MMGRHGGPGPMYGAPFWQRRFLRIAISIALLWIGGGFVFGFLFDGRQDDHGGGRSGPWLVPVVVGAAVVATVVAYRQ